MTNYRKQTTIIAASDVSHDFVKQSLKEAQSIPGIETVTVQDLLLSCHTGLFARARHISANSTDQVWLFVDNIEISQFSTWQQNRNFMITQKPAPQPPLHAEVSIPEGTSLVKILKFFVALHDDMYVCDVSFSGALFGYQEGMIPQEICGLMDYKLQTLEDEIILSVSCGCRRPGDSVAWVELLEECCLTLQALTLMPKREEPPFARNTVRRSSQRHIQRIPSRRDSGKQAAVGRQKSYTNKNDSGRRLSAYQCPARSKSYTKNDSGRRLSAHPSPAMDLQAKPMAELFLDTTVLHASISGFTAWSSSREPTQIFTLLETLYQAFDDLAKKHRVFKAETVGDCYVAVCGLPGARDDHACAMARFASDILSRMHILTEELEVLLGPDTTELDLRIGMHSGPITAGILRGERERVQLFGDTMFTCGRMEQTGRPATIHCSKATAELLRGCGKESWLTKQSVKDSSQEKKGQAETYWVKVWDERRVGRVLSVLSVSSQLPGLDEKTNRLIDWNVERLLQILKVAVAQRSPTASRSKRPSPQVDFVGTPLEQIAEIIELPGSQKRRHNRDPELAEIPTDVVSQLHHLVSTIASMYKANPFHSFDHASHVVLSVTKLMSRFEAPNCYGITNDPMIQFACAFSALIHDLDHDGVSNEQLVKEGVALATKYNGRSVAEQNSLDLSWGILMSSRYNELRSFLFPKRTDLAQFQQVVVNSVMATDIADNDMKDLRNDRWDKAFKKGNSSGWVDEHPEDEVNRKATIVIEHIIQASDISHTMQHFNVYRKWNKRLFEELYVAYLNGRMEKDPAEFWYKGEFGFFDFYIIPLTQKLKDCGVFGVSSDELLNYAKQNRERWELEGEDIVAELIAEVRRKYGLKGAPISDKSSSKLRRTQKRGVGCPPLMSIGLHKKHLSEHKQLQSLRKFAAAPVEPTQRYRYNTESMTRLINILDEAEDMLADDGFDESTPLSGSCRAF